jgi:phenylpyruvate tautomerase PptA (4-oxalocrotonate tautomerase family)
MPMLDAYIPEGALTGEAEEQLLAQLTDLLLRHEGADPSSPQARSLAWVFLHRPESVFVAGARAQAPRYKFIASVPEGLYTPERRQAMVEAVTTAALDAEQGRHPRDPMRVWVFANEIPERTWGGGGRIVGLADIAGFVRGEKEGAVYARAVLSQRRRETLEKLGLRETKTPESVE